MLFVVRLAIFPPGLAQTHGSPVFAHPILAQPGFSRPMSPGRRTLVASFWTVSRRRLCGWPRGAATGPIPFGLAYDFFGGYTPAIAGLLVLPVLAAVAVSQARPPDNA